MPTDKCGWKTRRNRRSANIRRPDAKTAVVDAIRCMPIELCNIIVDYIIRQPHTWTGFDDSASVTTTDTDAELKVRDAPTWHTFVSGRPLATGYLNWSVRWSTGFNPQGKRGWTGVGITLSTANKQQPNGGYDDMTDNNDCLLTFHVMDGRRYTKVHKTAETDGDLLRSMHTGFGAEISEIWFSADLVERTITASWRDRFRSDFCTDWFTDASADFESIRPCVVMAGCGTAVVRSAPVNDCPADCQRLIIRFASSK